MSDSSLSTTTAVLAWRDLVVGTPPMGLVGLSSEQIVGYWLSDRPLSTSRTYAQALVRFANELSVEVTEAVDLLIGQSLDVLQIRMDDYARRLGTHFSLSTMKLSLAALQSLSLWAQEHGKPGAVFRMAHLAAFSSTVNDSSGPRKIFDVTGFEKLLLAAREEETVFAERNVAILLLVYEARFTVADLSILKVDDLDLDAGYIHFQGRRIRLTLRQVTALQAWMQVRRPMGSKAWWRTDTTFVFPGDKGPLTERAVRYSLRFLCARVGLPAVSASDIRDAGLASVVRQGVLSANVSDVRASRGRLIPILETTTLLGDDQ